MGITLADMDSVFRAEKGWTRYDNQGREYVYEYCVPDSIIRIKVSSGVPVAGAFYESNPIRMWAIAFQLNPKSVWGLCKSVSIKPTEGWQSRVKSRYSEVLAVAKSNLSVTGKR